MSVFFNVLVLKMIHKSNFKSRKHLIEMVEEILNFIIQLKVKIQEQGKYRYQI